METYKYYPPQMHSTRIPYEILVDGAADCEHELLDCDWCDSLIVQEGLVFVTFSCKHCGRQVCQSLEEIVPPISWKGGSWTYKANRMG
jgi:hypothetical protein